MSAYYNEIDPFAAAWLRELIKEGLIADGEVDERDIRDVQPEDVRGFTQCHFFAGIGGWSYALRLAGWSDDRPVWTGSCPCQPFSAAGKGGGFADPRHLWPSWFRLIAECRPRVVVGEQVESAMRHGWLDLVFDDLEGGGYACWATGEPAAGIGAAHIRSRLWWVAESPRDGREHGASNGRSDVAGVQPREPWRESGVDGVGKWLAESEHAERGAERVHGGDGRDGAHGGWKEAHGELGARSEVRRLADANLEGSGGRRIQRPGESDGAGLGATRERPTGLCADGGLADADDAGPQGRHERRHGPDERTTGPRGMGGGWPLPSHLGWRPVDWLLCRDAQWRPVEPGTFPLAHALPARVGRLRGYGNAIDAEVAAAFIGAYMDIAVPLSDTQEKQS